MTDIVQVESINDTALMAGIIDQLSSNGQDMVLFSAQENGLSFFKCYRKEGGKFYLQRSYSYGPEGNEGIDTYYYPNGNKKSETPYTKGKKDGLALEYFQDGTKKTEQTYQRDILEGRSATYHSNGNVDTECNYKSDQIDGDFLGYFREGTPKIKRHYTAGVLNGLEQTYNRNGSIETQYPYVNGIIHGYAGGRRESDGGNAFEATYENGYLTGTATIWNEGGKKALTIEALSEPNHYLETTYDAKGRNVSTIQTRRIFSENVKIDDFDEMGLLQGWSFKNSNNRPDQDTYYHSGNASIKIYYRVSKPVIYFIVYNNPCPLNDGQKSRSNDYLQTLKRGDAIRRFFGDNRTHMECTEAQLALLHKKIKAFPQYPEKRPVMVFSTPDA